MKSMRVKRFLVITLSVMMLFSTFSPSMYGISFAAEDNENVETESTTSNVLSYTNADTEEVQKGESDVYNITVTGEKDFAEGSSVYIASIPKKEVKSYIQDLNAYLEPDLLSAEPVLPFMIDLFDANNNSVQLDQTVNVVISPVQADELKNTFLYHQTEDGSWEKVAYQLFETKEGSSVEFNVDTFSPFIFVTETELKEPTTEAKEEVAPKGESKSDETVSKEENKTEETQTKESETSKKSSEESSKGDVDSLTGSHTTKKNVDSVVLYNESAESKKEAVDTLTDDLSFSKKKANAIASDLFAAKGNRGAEEEEDVPRQGDGSNIEYISAKWITGDSVTNDDDSLLYYKPESDNPFDVRLQFNYALSGEHNYEPGDIVITIPENIIKTRSGKYAGHVILPYPEEPSTKSDFNWKLVNGNYVLTNTKRMSAATKGYIQVGFDELIPHELVDMEVSEDFDAYIEVTTHKGNTIALRSNKLSAQFDTEARIVKDSLRKKQYGQIERVPASEIPASQRIEGEEEYLVVQWYVWGAVTANTYYTMDIVDHIPQDAQVTSDLKESDVHGFILKATSEDGTVLEDRNVYRGYGSGQTRYYYYKTAYPASQFEPNVQYTFHNDAEMTITEVDPPAEVTNANVQEEDPQLVTGAQAAANPNWSYTLPEWHNPTGHFMVCKNGNDDKVGDNKTHHSQYSGSAYSDIHIWKNRSYIDLWYGIYPSAMNDLDDGKDVNLSYTIDSVGYTMPWMFDAGSYSTDGEMAARKSVNYSKPVTMITEDTGVRIGNSQQKLKVFDDYEFVSIEFPIRPYVYTGTPKNINPDGSWTALTAGDGTFEYVLDKDYSHYPDIVLELYRNGEWGEYATVSWTTGEPKITLKDGTEVSGAIVDVPSDTENFRTKVTVQNTLGANPGNLISQAAIDYDVRPLIKLINTDNIKQIVEDGFAASHSPSMTVRNSVNMKAYGEESAEPIVSIDKEGHDVLRGYTTDIEVYPSKSSKQTIKDADYVNRRVKIHYSAKVEERSVINDNKTYMQAIEDGRLAAETHGVWYDLLPKGVTPDVSTVTLRSGDKVINARTVENYKKSGRTLLIVEAELTPVPERYRSGDMYYYEDVPRISFDAWYDFDAMTDYGKAIHNVIAFESSNDKIGTTDGYSGEYDNPNTGDDHNVSTHLAFKTDEEKEWMTDLNPDRDTPSFVYAGTTTSIDIISAARLSLQKDVMVNNDGIWGSGVFNSDRVSEDGTETFQYNEQSKKDNEMVVWEGGLYSYKLRMMPDDETRARDMVIYDSIETFKAGNGNEPIDEMAAKANATWQGDFMSVDVSQLEEKGCAPVVYYSTIENLPLSDENDPTIGKKANMLFKDDGTINTSVWIKAEDYQGNPADVTAVAVDASKKADGSDFTLEPLESVVILINMRAPSGQAARDIVANAGAWGTSAYAYNNAYLTGTTIDINTLDEDGDNFVRKDYTKVGLVEYKYDVKKVWDDENNRDGKRPENVVVNLYANGVATGDSIVLDESNKWEGSFEHIPYTTPDGTKIRYSAVENEVDDYTTDINAAETTAKITNKHEPERISLDVAKNWVNDTEENRPEYITVELYGNGKKIASKCMDKTTEWKCSFADLYKNENGLPIRYTAKEIFPSGDVKHLSYVANDPDGIVLAGVLDPVTGPDFDDPLGLDEDEFDGEFTNTYHPHGDLYVTKNVTDVTDVSKEQEFSFTFNFNKTVEGEVVPVLTEYDYDVLDENREVVSSGKVTDNSVVKIKGGQKIHVKEIDEYVSYKVSEGEEAGFSQINAQNTEGIIRPNSSAQALFENKYAANGQLNLNVDKTLKNRALKKYQFKFELYEVTEEEGTEKETLIRTATSGKPDDPVLREDGTVESSHAVASFGTIRYTQADAGKTFTYKVKEVKANKPGYVYDTNEYIVRVAVTDNGDGTLNIDKKFEAEQCSECGGTGCDGDFYRMPTTAGIPLVKDPDELNFDNGLQYMSFVWTSDTLNDRKHTYQDFADRLGKIGTVTKGTINIGGVDSTEYITQIEFSGHDEKLDELYRKYADSLNAYTSADTNIYNNGVGRCVLQFTSGYHDSALDADCGSYSFFVWPRCESCNGTGYSHGNPNGISFINEYKAKGDLTLRAWKDLQGRSLKDKEFTFDLIDEDGYVISSVENTSDGSVVFPALSYDETDIGKTYHYAIREKIGTDETVNYDESVYGYEVTVFDNGDGTLSFSQGTAKPILSEVQPGIISSVLAENAQNATRYVQIRAKTGLSAGKYLSGTYLCTMQDLISYEDVQADPQLASEFVQQVWAVPYETTETTTHRKFYALVNGFTGNQLAGGWYVSDEPYVGGGGLSYPGGFLFDETNLLEMYNQQLYMGREYYNEGYWRQIKSRVTAGSNGKPEVRSTFFDPSTISSADSYEFIDIDPRFLNGADVEIIGWETEEAELPVFKNTLKDGSLSVTKHVTNAENADPNQKFKFKVKLIGDNIKDKEFDYELSQVIPKGEPSLTVKFVDPDTQEPIPNVSVICRTQPQGNGNVIGSFVADENGEITLFFEDLDMSEYDGAKYLYFEPSNAPSPYYAPTPNGDWNEWVTVVWHDNTLDMYPSYYSWSEVSGVPESGYVYTLALPKRTSKSASVKSDGVNEINEKSLEKTTKDISADKTTASKPISSRIAEKIIPPVHAATKTGTSGTCKWEINDSGVLRIYPSNGASGQLDSYTNTNAPWYSYRSSVKKVVVVNGVKTNEGCRRLFSGLKNCTEMDLSGLDTSSATNMKQMFSGCSKLTTLDVSTFNTNNVTDTSYMFYDCAALTTLNVNNLDTANVTDMSYMFRNCSNLVSLDLSSFNTSNVKNMTNMFGRCIALKNLDISSFVTNNVTNMEYMFYTCSALKNIDVTHFNTSNVTNMSSLFDECSSLKSINVSNFDTSNVTNMSGMFSGCSSITNLDLSNFNTSNVTNMSNMFNSSNKLKRLNLSNFDTKKLKNMTYMFRYCDALAYLDLSSFDTNSVSNMNSPFDGTTNLSCIVLGEDFVFKTWITCTEPNNEYTGKWIREDELFGPYTADEFAQNYDGSTMAGVWIWEKRPITYTLNFATEEGATGAMPPVKPTAANEYKLPENQFVKFGYEFEHWDDGAGHTYANKGTIPANTYSAGSTITLTASFAPRNTTVNMENGEFEFELYGGETATFNNIPAGTAYQVYEETPDGWVLIEQSNTSGKIEPLETSEASFTNKYEPGTATAQFFGTKTLDGRAAEEGSYSFVLDETTEGASGTVKMLVDGEEQDVELPYTVTVSEGGFIQFPAIKYSIDDIGTHTYTIKEVNPNDDHIDYDTHTETVTVNVTGDITELKAETVIDEDGDGKISFANKTRPGILKIKKTANMITSGNQDDMFTFKVTLQNDKGMPFDDTIYWYREKNGVPVIDSQNTNKAKKQSAVNVDNTANINANDVSVGETTKSAFNSKFAVFGATSGGNNNTRATVVASGTAPGGCPWRVTSDRKLIYGKEGYTYNLGPGWIREGVAGYTSSGVGNGTWPTFDYINGGKYDDNGQVSDILFEGEVHLRGPLIDIIYSPCSWLNDNKGRQYWGRASTLDLSNANVTNSTSYNGIFASADTLRTISNYDPSMFTGENVVDFGYMFASSAYDKHGLDATKLDTSSGKYFDDMFNDAGARELLLSNMYTGEGINFMYTFNDTVLEKLDIRNFDTRNASIMRGMFYVPRDSNNTKLSSITLGPNFRFKGNGIESANDQAILPTPPEEFTTGKWVRADNPDMVFTPEELRDAYDADPENMAGTWIWEVDTSKGIVRFDANGGYTSANQIKATSADQAITMPGNKTTRFGYMLTGWNTKADGSGREIGPNDTVNDIVSLGSYMTLYAQWAEDPSRDYKVEHYQQKSDLSGYTLVKTDTLKGDKNTDVTPEPLHYDGFVSPEPQTATVAEDGSTVISYYYDRVIYNVTFDGNGATAGQMKDVSRVSNVSAALPKNTYQKAGHIFLGWSTDPDATVAEYNDGSYMRKLINDGEGLTLYAVWMSNEDSAIVPQNGEVYVKCKPGETIVIPNLPAGTTYTVEEVDMPGGWTYSGTTGDTGNPIIPNVANMVTVRNNYSLQGSATIVAHKTLEKSDVEEGQFTFELLDSSQRVLQTVTNGPVDNTDVLVDEDGNEIGENPWKGSAPVEFSPIHYTNTGTYVYYIREKRGNEDNVVYDEHVEKVTVVLTDAGRGFLSADVRYDDDGALFENTLTPGKLKVHKTVVGEDESDESFDFSIRLKDKDGHLIDGPIDATKVWKNPVVVQPEGHVTKYSHTSNINDNGVKQSDFESSRYYSDIISVPGADHLDLSIDYTNPRGFLCIWDDAHSEARYMTGSSSNWTQDFKPDTAQEYIAWTSNDDDNIILHRNVRVEGDSATIVFYSYAYPSNSCPLNNGGYNENTNYGYYAVVDACFDEKVLSGEPVSLENGGTFSLKDGESLEISDLEEGSTYEVTELPKDGWLLVSSEGAEGEIVKGATSEASFVNTPGTPPPYEADGQALLKAKKTMTGGTIKAEDGFVFELLDNNGNVLQTKNVDQLGGSSSDITFDPIAYTEKDAGVPVEYDVQVMLMKNGETVPTIITLDQNEYTESGDSISGSFAWDDAAYADYNRKQVVVSVVPKDPELSEYTKQEVVDMSDKSSVEFSFDSLTKSVGGEYRYTIREQKGNSDNVAYDTTNYEAVVTVLDNGDGSLNTQVEYLKGDEAVSEAEFVNERLSDIHIVKKDKDTLTTLPNAKFTIKSGNQYLHSDGTLSETAEEFVTNNRGEINVSNIPSGTYTLHETSAPTGYKLANDVVFMVDENGTMVNGTVVDEITVLDEIDTHDIMIGKTVSGNMGDVTEDFEFEITFRDSRNTLFDPGVVPDGVEKVSNGTYKFILKHNDTVVFENIPYGTSYVVTETRADENGYETSVTTQVGNAGNDKIVRGTLTDDESITYVNERDSVTPTGVGHTDMLLLLLIFTALLGFIVFRKIRKETT